MTRREKIDAAKNKIAGIKLVLGPLEKHLEDAKHELRRAEKSFDKGERVHVTETCKRGCCVENEYDGTVTGETKNGMWNIKADSGHLYEYVYEGDMKRLK